MGIVKGGFGTEVWAGESSGFAPSGAERPPCPALPVGAAGHCRPGAAAASGRTGDEVEMYFINIKSVVLQSNVSLSQWMKRRLQHLVLCFECLDRYKLRRCHSCVSQLSQRDRQTPTPDCAG